MEVEIVWLKRDLRLSDHICIEEASRSGRAVLLLYVAEPMLQSHDHYSNRHWQFVDESLADMDLQLEEYQTKVLKVSGDFIPFIDHIRTFVTISAIYSYEEVGVRVTFDRDIAFRNYCKKNSIKWNEYPNNGVIRGKSDRKGWTKHWYTEMAKPIIENELNKTNFLSTQRIEQIEARCQNYKYQFTESVANYQKGGEKEALQVLDTFLEGRIRQYNQGISKPGLSRISCSRLSPYLTWGNISLKQVYQAIRDFRNEGNYKRQASSVLSRLRWRSHFMQKFESESRMEFESVNKGYALLKRDGDHENLQKWQEGRTGFPLVDASMRCLNTTGYINFRMRAMLTSFATHLLWLPWQLISPHLARQFLDFEPGIHFPQLQMQAGETGTNSIRIYNPVKQGYDHDPDGEFIRTWVPELDDLSTEFLHEPWKASDNLFSNSFNIGKDYFHPVVDHVSAARNARKAIWSHRSNELVKSENKRILKKHTIRGGRVQDR